jgi:DNA repair protein RecO
MEEKKTEGLLLQAIPYLGNQKILKVLTAEDGIVSLMAKTKSLLPFTNPFLIAEWVYKKGNREIHSLVDATLCNNLSNLRTNFETLSSAGQIAQDLLRSQYPEKIGRGPYALSVAFLQKLPQFAFPEVLVASFRLKLLMHDGLLSFEGELCGFSCTEWELLQQLTFVRQFHVLQSLAIEPATQEKIKNFFYSLIG